MKATPRKKKPASKSARTSSGKRTSARRDGAAASLALVFHRIKALAPSDPIASASLSVLYAELARAQVENDTQAVDYIVNAIREATSEPPDPIDEPLDLRRATPNHKASPAA